MNRLAVSIVTYNAEQDIRACLEALKRQTYSEFNLFIVDNASTDNTRSLIREICPEATLIENDANLGFGAGHNIAISQTDAEWILLLNADAVLDETALATFMSRVYPSDVAAVGGILYSDQEKKQVDSTAIQLNRFTYHASERKAIPLQDDYPWGISGACILLRKEALSSIAYPRNDRSYPEYFDERFFLYKEDLDLSARLQSNGWRSQFISKEVGIHSRTGAKEKSRKDLPDHVRVNSYKNHFYFLLKHARLKSLPFILTYEVAKFAYLLFAEPATLRVLPDVVRMAPTMIKRRYV